MRGGRFGVGAFAQAGQAGVDRGGLVQDAGAVTGVEEVDLAIVAAPLLVELRPAASAPLGRV